MFLFFCVFFCFVSFFSLTKLLPQTHGFCGWAQSLGERSAAARGAHGIREAPAGAALERVFPVEPGTLRLTPPPSLLPLQFPWSWLSGCGQPRRQTKTRRKKKKRKKKGKEKGGGRTSSPARWVGSPQRPVGLWLWVTGPPQDWALLAPWGQSLRVQMSTLRTSPRDQLVAWSADKVSRRGPGLPALRPCHPHSHWPGVCACRAGHSGLGDLTVSRRGGGFEKGTKSGWGASTMKHLEQNKTRVGGGAVGGTAL